MSTPIKDGTGKGYAAKVDINNRLYVDSRSHTLQHDISHRHQRAFQVRGEATPVSGSATVLHINNGNTTQALVITYLRLQAVGLTGGTAVPDTGNYFDVNFGRTYTSGGSSVTPINAYQGSAKTATDVTAYDSAPTVGGTALVLDRWYVSADGAMETFIKGGSVVVGPGQNMDITYTGDHTAGIVQARVSFLMLNEDE